MTSFELVVTLWNHIGTVGEKSCEFKVLNLALFGLLPSIQQTTNHLPTCFGLNDLAREQDLQQLV